MKDSKVKTSKLNINKGQLAVKIVCGLLAGLMIISSFATVIYYVFSSFGK